VWVFTSFICRSCLSLHRHPYLYIPPTCRFLHSDYDKQHTFPLTKLSLLFTSFSLGIMGWPSPDPSRVWSFHILQFSLSLTPHRHPFLYSPYLSLSTIPHGTARGLLVQMCSKFTPQLYSQCVIPARFIRYHKTRSPEDTVTYLPRLWQRARYTVWIDTTTTLNVKKMTNDKKI